MKKAIKTTEEYNFSNSKKIAQKHKVLLANPLFIDKLDDLIKYVDTQNIKTEELSPLELQNKFSDYLGTTTVFCELRSKDPASLIKNLNQKRQIRRMKV